MNAQDFDELAWKNLLGEATAPEQRALAEIRATDEFLGGRYDQMDRDYHGLQQSLDVVSAVRSETEEQEVPKARLEAMLNQFGSGAQKVAASVAEPPVIKQEAKSSAAGWATGAIAAGIIGLLKVLSHEAGPIVRMVEKTGAEVAGHGASRVEKVLEKASVNPATLEQFAKESAKAEGAAVRNGWGKAGVSSAVIGSALPLAAQDSTIAPRGNPAGLEYEVTADGPRVTLVRPDSPAFKAGIQPGDVVIEYNGVQMRGLTPILVENVFLGAPNGTVSVTVARGEALVIVTLHFSGQSDAP